MFLVHYHLEKTAGGTQRQGTVVRCVYHSLIHRLYGISDGRPVIPFKELVNAICLSVDYFENRSITPETHASVWKDTVVSWVNGYQVSGA